MHLTEEDPRAAGARDRTGAGWTCASTPSATRALELALRLTRKCGTVQAIGVYAERCEVHMGLAWIKALDSLARHANVIGHVDACSR